MAVILNMFFRQLMRDSRHLKEQKEGRQMIAQRLGIPGPWLPEMVNYPSFVCAHCHFPHILRQTLLGCNACAAPYHPSEVVSLNKNGRLKCVTCEAEQAVAEMPFCCTNCRCIQSIPSRLDWRKTFTQFPASRSYLGPAISMILGLLVILIFVMSSQQGSQSHASDLIALGLALGSVPLVLGIIVAVVMLLRKKMPPELMLSCGGFGILTKEGEERWFSWQDVRGVDARQPSNQRSILIDTTASAQPDSIAVGWIVHTTREVIFFDSRLKDARELGRQIRMRAPAAPLVDLPPMERTSPWTVIATAFVILLIAAISIALSLH
ncbi:MAG: hypothetical protein JWL77_6476 [Chthonomonadaceae bacterium]|nr:hypothetical protein [Chthonomonadaceae bacterium]